MDEYELVVAIEGQIGAGKTTVVENFREKTGYEVIEEPVEMWRCFNDVNMLGKTIKCN